MHGHLVAMYASGFGFYIDLVVGAVESNALKQAVPRKLQLSRYSVADITSLQVHRSTFRVPVEKRKLLSVNPYQQTITMKPAINKTTAMVIVTEMT